MDPIKKLHFINIQDNAIIAPTLEVELRQEANVPIYVNYPCQMMCFVLEAVEFYI